MLAAIFELSNLAQGAFLCSNPKKVWRHGFFGFAVFNGTPNRKKVYNHKNTRCHAIMNDGQETGNNVIC